MTPIERGPWYYFIPPMRDYVPEREPLPTVVLSKKQVHDAGFGKPSSSLLQIMLDDDEAGKRQTNG